ncbi:hypothetical protein [endosymbiont of Lamellibrachia barhami]|uniref:hypothetical protein n=1 Tax=endosymbiont of Lamellibrachia barhami TaxID=205975 RepID=UPI001FE2E0C6|nr:hypothetical protein [endosymbiont of Lamellibrachia barhami]
MAATIEQNSAEALKIASSMRDHRENGSWTETLIVVAFGVRLSRPAATAMIAQRF